jgi:hypothetical protein
MGKELSFGEVLPNQLCFKNLHSNQTLSDGEDRWVAIAFSLLAADWQVLQQP